MFIVNRLFLYQKHNKSDVKVLAPSSVVDTVSDSPFIILFYGPEMAEEGDEDEEKEDSIIHSRRKRFVEISPDLEESHVRRNFYEHDKRDEIETKIVPFDQKEENRKESDSKFLDEDGNGVKDIDEEARLVTLLIMN